MTATLEPTAAAPRYLTRARPSSSAGVGQLAPVAELLGRPLRPWTEMIAGAALDRTDGHWRYPIVVLSVPRQAGKTTFVGAVAIERAMSQPGSQIWYTAQSRLDAQLRFRDFVALLDESELRRGRRISEPGTWDYRALDGQGGEAIIFPNCSEIRIFAPREDSLHGSVTDLVIIDEARFFPIELGNRLLAAVLPTQVTRDGQMWIVSTAGGPESTFLAEQMERGRAATRAESTRICYGEWGIAEDLGAGELLDAAWATHPAAGLPGGPTRAAFELAAETMPAWQFAQEYGNRWRSEELDRLVPSAWWAAAISVHGPRDPLTFALDAAPDRSQAAIVACGGGILEVVKAERGARWLAPEIMRLVGRHETAAVVADPSGPAVTAVEALAPLLGDRLVTVKTRELVAACGGLYDALEAGVVRHHPHPALDHAVAKASQRAVSGSWVFARSDGGHALVAAALAYWAQARPPELALDEPAVY